MLRGQRPLCLAGWRNRGTTACLPACLPRHRAGARTVGVGLLCTTLALGCCGFSRGGFSVNHMDVAPKFAGVVM